MKVDVKAIVQNFPTNVDDHDQALLDEEIPNNCRERCAFRNGWRRAIIAVNDKIYDAEKAEREKAPLVSGWVCPRCGSVYGLLQSECWRCNPTSAPIVAC